jgi:phosphocarrier protein HPr
MNEIQLTVAHQSGLHARPAAMFVSLANKYLSSISVLNLTEGSAPVDAKSILGILTLGVCPGHTIQVRAEGPDEAEAVAALARLVNSNFSEA